MNLFNRVMLEDAMTESTFFPKHGLHMNTRGKENMAKKLADVIHETANMHGKNRVYNDMDR